MHLIFDGTTDPSKVEEWVKRMEAWDDAYSWARCELARTCSATLSGVALDVYQSMVPADKLDWEAIKKKMCETFKPKWKSSELALQLNAVMWKKGEALMTLYLRLVDIYRKVEGGTINPEAMDTNRYLIARFIQCLSGNPKIHEQIMRLKEDRLSQVLDAALREELVQQQLVAASPAPDLTDKVASADYKYGQRPKSPITPGPGSIDECYRCHRPGHRARQCKMTDKEIQSQAHIDFVKRHYDEAKCKLPYTWLARRKSFNDRDRSKSPVWKKDTRQPYVNRRRYESPRPVDVPTTYCPRDQSQQSEPEVPSTYRSRTGSGSESV